MIKANELRLGNWLRSNKNGQSFPITAIEFSWNYIVYFESIPHALQDCDPIELNSTILQKAGFTKRDVDGGGENIRMELLSRSFLFYTDDSVDLTKVFVQKGKEIIGRCQYLHELQNLYFALTGEELEISL